jgi:hypothetical protein
MLQVGHRKVVDTSSLGIEISLISFVKGWQLTKFHC